MRFLPKSFTYLIKKVDFIEIFNVLSLRQVDIGTRMPSQLLQLYAQGSKW